MPNQSARQFVFSMRFLAACALLGTGLFAVAQDKIPTEETQKISKRLVETLGKPTDPQVAVDADPDRGEGYRHGELGFIAIPDRKLTAEALNAAAAEPIPVGHLWMKGIGPVSEGRVVPNAQLRTISIAVDNQTVDVSVCLLGARKKDGKLELVLFGNGKTPVLVAALEPDQSNAAAPISTSAQKEDDETGKIELILAGKYKAKILMKKCE